MWRMGVPVATPVTVRDFLQAVLALAKFGECRRAFECDIRDLLRVPFVRSTNSGRSALFVTLQAMKRFSPRDEVVIPAFVCPSVGRAVIKAGLKPVLCDVGPGGSGLATEFLERVATQRTLAVVTAHLYGYPCDITSTLEVSRSTGAFVIEDAAQAFGAKLRGRYVGTVADVGIFSFGMSKVLWSINGGLIVTSDSALAQYIDSGLASSPEAGMFSETVDVARLGVLRMLVRSQHLGPIAALWSSAMRGKHDSNDFDALMCPPSHAAIARALLPRLAEITGIRSRHASYFSTCLSSLDEIILPNANPASEPVFLRFPIVVKDLGIKKELLAILRAKGINASEMYTRPSYEALRLFAGCDSECPRTEYLAERMLNLPTHPYMQERDLRDAVSAFDVVRGRRRTVATTRRKGAVVTAN